MELPLLDHTAPISECVFTMRFSNTGEDPGEMFGFLFLSSFGASQMIIDAL